MTGKLILVLTILIPTTAAAESLIVEEGEPRAEIIIAKEPTRTQQLAADELRDHIEKISGAALDVRTSPSDHTLRIYVGRSTHTDRLGIDTKGLANGAYRIVSGRDWIALIGDDADFQPHDLHARDIADRARVRAEWDRLTGGRWALPIDKTDRRRHAETGWWQDDKRGSLNAVYHFLRELGVRWFMPGELGEVVPKMASIPLLPQSFNGKPKATVHPGGRNADALPLNEFLFDRTVRPDFAHNPMYPDSPSRVSNSPDSERL